MDGNDTVVEMTSRKNDSCRSIQLDRLNKLECEKYLMRDY